MIASLSMYERPETIDALNALWSSVRDTLTSNGIAAPRSLTQHATGMDTWLNKELLLSQTCGLPYRAALHDQVQLIGAPDLQIKDCAPGYYCSVIVVRVNDERADLKAFENARVVCNSLTSQSGYAALRQHWEDASLVWPTDTEQTLRFSGGHRASAKAVADGHADITALDILSYSLMQAHDDFTDQLRILETTTPTPALPFICAPQFDSGVIAQALRTGVQALTEEERQTLGLHGIVELPAELYHRVPTPQESRDAFAR